MKRKITIFAMLTIVCLGIFQYSLLRKDERKQMLTLLDIEKLAYAEDNPINYHVPDKSNNPKGCTLEVWVSGSVNTSEGSADGHFKKVQGMKNFCKGSGTGCDPYNCHQRVN